MLVSGCRRGSVPRQGNGPAPGSLATDAPGPAAGGTAPLRDDLGRAWEGALPARRVVSLAPNVTEIVGALGACDRLAGVDTASDYPPEIKQIERVGDFLNPSVERLVALRADVVLLSSATITAAAAAEACGRWHTPVFVLNARRLPDVARNVRAIARILGVDARGEEVAAEMERRFAAVSRAVKGRPRRRVFLEVWHDPLTTVGPGTVQDGLIGLAGGENVAASQRQEFPTYSIEALLGADPDVYLVTTMQKSLGALDPARRHGFSGLRAVREKRVVRVPADPVLRPTPRLAEGAEALARAIHPEAFR